MISLKEYYIKRYIKVCIPVILWAVAIFAMSTGVSVKVLIVYILNLQGLGNMYNKLNLPYSGLGMRHTWFVTIIMMCYLLIPILQKLKHGYTQKQFKAFLIIRWGVSISLGIFGINAYYFPLFITGYYVSLYNEFDTVSAKKYAVFTTFCTFILLGRIVCVWH